MIVDAFLTLLRNAVYGDSVTYPTHMAVGTGTTAAAAGNTTMETEVFPDGADRNTISSRTKPTAKSVRLQMIVAAGEANGSTLTEMGCLNAATAGTLTNRIIHTGIAKDSSFQLKYQITITFSDA